MAMVRYSNAVNSGRRIGKDARSDAVEITMRCSNTIAMVGVVCSKGNGCEIVERDESRFEDVGRVYP